MRRRLVDLRGWVTGALAGGGLAAALLAAAPHPARAQSADCRKLYAAIQGGDGSSRSGQWDRAAQQQRREMDRTQRYADQLGCGHSGLFGTGLFGDDPPSCRGLTDRIQRMQENLDRMEARGGDGAQGGGDPDRRASLIARYNAACGGADPANPAQLAQGGDAGFLPSEGRNPAEMANPDDLSSVPLDGSIMDDSGEPRRNLGQAICVRTCDGGYFPLGSRATSDQLGGLEQLCQASCPNTEARLYTMGQEGDLASATAADGASYTALPAAFQFEKTYSAACTCKPPGQSWVEALAEAEKLLGGGSRHDITVTASLSDQMARPGAASAAPGKAGKGQRTLPSSGMLADLSTAREAQKGQQAPTASNETTGIGGPVRDERVVRAGEGPTVAVAGPDGVRKRIRLIVP